ncbi:hypothetical protein P3T32_000495 [Ralstonia sp. GP73]|uniref:hypothetical protein n=1 Tax=Ralstonia TaxID=48736 RepID=UPI0003F8EFEE|nr:MULTISPECIES: hypothetical protein [Ralstonia]MDH6640660.1 hypothetical protein [Ralstonia sp. GP73]OCS51504.1 hypothetical protein BEK68_18130 [Ralstonia pickettii]
MIGIAQSVALAIRATLRRASVMARHHDYFIEAAPVHGIVSNAITLMRACRSAPQGFQCRACRFFEWLRDNTGSWI